MFSQRIAERHVGDVILRARVEQKARIHIPDLAIDLGQQAFTYAHIGDRPARTAPRRLDPDLLLVNVDHQHHIGQRSCSPS